MRACGWARATLGGLGKLTVHRFKRVSSVAPFPEQFQPLPGNLEPPGGFTDPDAEPSAQ